MLADQPAQGLDEFIVALPMQLLVRATARPVTDFTARFVDRHQGELAVVVGSGLETAQLVDQAGVSSAGLTELPIKQFFTLGSDHQVGGYLGAPGARRQLVLAFV